MCVFASNTYLFFANLFVLIFCSPFRQKYLISSFFQENAEEIESTKSSKAPSPIQNPETSGSAGRFLGIQHFSVLQSKGLFVKSARIDLITNDYYLISAGQRFIKMTLRYRRDIRGCKFACHK